MCLQEDAEAAAIATEAADMAYGEAIAEAYSYEE